MTLQVPLPILKISIIPRRFKNKATARSILMKAPFEQNTFPGCFFKKWWPPGLVRINPSSIRLSLIFFIFIAILPATAQQTILKGEIKNEKGEPIAGVNVSIAETAQGIGTNALGSFSIKIPSNQTILLVLRHLEYNTLSDTIIVGNQQGIVRNFVLTERIRVLNTVEIRGKLEDKYRGQAGVTQIDAINATLIPSPFGEFNKVLSSLPGVTSNNELSSAYSVRGGNFDENLVYVNDIPVYRPFLIRAGQQEGLSFINPALVGNIEFSAGGWQPKYGDKLSSSLNIDYKVPEEWAGHISAGLLGGSTHLEGTSANKRVSYLMGARHKNAQYILNTLETKGEYLPRFTDVQSYINIGLGIKKVEDKPKTELGILMAYAQNRYFVKPGNRETTFGTIDRVFRLFVAFEGQELLEYDSYQAGLKLTHKFNKKLISDFIFSGLYTSEREYFDIEGGYRLCDVNNNPGSADFNSCISIRGVGTNYAYARNILKAVILNAESRNKYRINKNNLLEFGLGYAFEDIDDKLNEYTFVDSADFVFFDNPIRSEAALQSSRLTGYVQHSSQFAIRHALTYGVRANFWSLNQQLLVSPRLQYTFKPAWEKDVVLKAAAGLYQQPPFYRELRNFSGEINRKLKAQSSLHLIGGIDYNFEMWGREFKFLSEAYYKYLYNVVPYDVDNVRIRYYGENLAKAYAAGIDFRVNGEFIPGAESWFSLGILTTQENLDDGNGYVRRPSDQRVNLGIFFQDHFPNDPTIRVNLNLLYGTGLPFGPPNNTEYRNAFTGKAYRRVDIGFSKVFNVDAVDNKFLIKSVWLGAEILNLLGANNIISYTWISDVNNQQFGVPNALSARFFNVRGIVRF